MNLFNCEVASACIIALDSWLGDCRVEPTLPFSFVSVMEFLSNEVMTNNTVSDLDALLGTGCLMFLKSGIIQLRIPNCNIKYD